jgi:hypothetical protein
LRGVRETNCSKCECLAGVLQVEGALGPTTEDVVRELCKGLKEARAAVDGVEGQAEDRGVVREAAEVESHIKAVVGMVHSQQGPGERQAGAKVAMGR